MRVVLAKQKKRGQPPQKRAVNLRFDLKAFNPLRPIWRWAQSKFVRQPSWHAFIGWQGYYAAYLGTDAPSALIHHSGPYVSSPDRQTELLDAMLAGHGATVVSAPPGCGKSRFALELARRIEREHPRWQAVFVRHDEQLVREELHRLMESKRVVFILDDAHECPELLELLAAACGQTFAAASLHLVCLTRSIGRAQVIRAVNSAFPPGVILAIDLARPSTDLVRTLIDQLLPQSSPHHRDTIARLARQSYFGAVLACSVLSREAKLPQTFQRHDLRDRISRESLRGTADGVCPIEAALRILAVYAALAPVPKTRADVRERAAEWSGLPPTTVDAVIDRSLKAALLQEDGRGLMRPMPDLLGDLILEQACLDASGNPTPFGTQLLEQLLEAEPAATVRNCAGIGQLFGTVQEVDLISKLVLERAQDIPVGSPWDALALLQRAQPLATVRPATVIELTRVMEARGIMRRSPPATELFSINSIEMSACALLMSAGEVDATIVPVVLNFGRDLYAATREDARSQEHLVAELKAYCRFEPGRSFAHAQAVADTLRGWVSEPDVEAAALAAALSAQFLTLEVESPRNAEHAPTSLRSPLIPVPEVWSVRDVAVDTLTRGMAHGDATVQCAVVGSLQHYADCREMPDQGSDRWLPQLTRETEQLSAAVSKLARETSRLPVSAAAELRGWQWWTRQQGTLQRAGAAILRAIPDTDAYRLWKLLYAPWLPVQTTLPEPAPARPEDRLRHVQGFSAAPEEERADQARKLFEWLDPRHPDIGAWRTLWLAVLEQSPGTPLDAHTGVVIGEFARRHAEAAWSFVNQADAEGPLFAVLPFLLTELGKLDRARRSSEARGVPPGTRLEEAWLRALSFTSDFDEPERTILARGLESADSDTVHHAADALLAATGNDRATPFLKVFRVIAHRPADSELWELAIDRFVSWAEDVLPPRSSAPADGMPRVADELIQLLRAHGSHLRWGFQRHTRQLAKALAIAAVLCPRRVQEWMQRHWGQPAATGGTWSDASPLSASRLVEMMRLLVDSPAAAQWIEAFIEWMKHDPRLAGMGALGLAELCPLDDGRVSQLGQTIGAHSTDASRKAFEEFVSQRKKRERPSSG
jgi:CBS domain-containing protein